MNNIDYAVYLAETYGIAVFPMVSGEKRPACKHGTKDATCDPDAVYNLFSSVYGGIPNIGLATGDIKDNHEPYTRVIAFDDDSHKIEGKESFIDIVERETGVPFNRETVSVKTGGGGRTYFFKDPAGLVQKGGASNELALDMRGNGLSSIIPFSKLNGKGSYEWILSPDDCDFADINDGELFVYEKWLDATKKSAIKSAGRLNLDGFEFKVEGTIPEGERNDALFRCVASLVSQGVPEDVILQIAYALNEYQFEEAIDTESIEYTTSACINRYETGKDSWFTKKKASEAVNHLTGVLIRKGMNQAVTWIGANAINAAHAEPMSDTSLLNVFNNKVLDLHKADYVMKNMGGNDVE